MSKKRKQQKYPEQLKADAINLVFNQNYVMVPESDQTFSVNLDGLVYAYADVVVMMSPVGSFAVLEPLKRK